MSRPEARLEAELLRALGGDPDVLLMKHETGLFYTRDGRPVRIGTPGSPDLVGAVHGVFVGFELKSDRGRVSPEQLQWHQAARARGAVVEVVRSVDEAREVIARVRKMGRW